MISDAKASKFLKIIYNGALHLQNVIEDALDLSRIENNKFEVNLSFFNIRESLEEIIEIMSFQVNSKGLYLNLVIDKSVPNLIKTDEKRYKQVLFNLIGNAIKFTFKGGVTIFIKYFDKRLTTTVQDTGMGIEPEAVKKLFQFFGKLQD